MQAERITRTQAGAGSVPDPFARLYTPKELAGLWQLSVQSIRRLFQDEAGVFVLGDSNPRGHRAYTSLRIPAAVAERVFRKRLTR